jgi:hypothetical protein
MLPAFKTAWFVVVAGTVATALRLLSLPALGTGRFCGKAPDGTAGA